MYKKRLGAAEGHVTLLQIRRAGTAAAVLLSQRELVVSYPEESDDSSDLQYKVSHHHRSLSDRLFLFFSAFGAFQQEVIGKSFSRKGNNAWWLVFFSSF